MVEFFPESQFIHILLSLNQKVEVEEIKKWQDFQLNKIPS